MNALFIFGALLTIVSAEAPLPFGPYPAPAPVYGPPRIIEPVAPYPPAIPAPVYGPPPQVVLPQPQIAKYNYEVYTPKHVEYVAPYPAPAPLIKTGPYPAPAPIAPYPAPAPIAPYPAPAPLIVKPVISTYNYEVPHIVPAPAPVYGPPAVPAPVYGPPEVPAPVYGPPPKIVLPAPEPILTSYDYPVYTPQPVVQTVGPYPAPAPLVHIPEVPVAPHTEYGAPVF